MITLTDSDFSKYKTPLAKGSYASIYPYSNDKVLKLWDNNLSLKTPYMIQYFIGCIQSLENYKNKALITKEEFAYYHENIKGYTMSLVNGVTLDKLKDVDIFKFFQALTEFYQNIQLACEERILLGDLHEKNIMYEQGENTDKMYVIDCDLWCRYKKIDKTYAAEKNLNILNSVILKSLCDNNCENERKRKVKFSYPINLPTPYEFSHDSGDIIDYLESLKEQMEHYTSSNIKTVKNFKKTLRNVLK